MTVLHFLWLPILLSAVFSFIASFILHTALPWHHTDYAKVPDEDKVLAALRPFALAPGDYVLPRCDSPKHRNSPEFAAKLQQGPVLRATVMDNGGSGMGKSLALWFVYLLAISFLSGYVTCHALPANAAHRRVCLIAGVTSFLGYAGALWQMSIWYCRSWTTTIKATIDGLIYALLTAATFGWLWQR